MSSNDLDTIGLNKEQVKEKLIGSKRNRQESKSSKEDIQVEEIRNTLNGGNEEIENLKRSLLDNGVEGQREATEEDQVNVQRKLSTDSANKLNEHEERRESSSRSFSSKVIYCHQCNQQGPRSSLLICANLVCKEYFCNDCAKKIPEKIEDGKHPEVEWICLKCQGLCTCKNCRADSKRELEKPKPQNNVITLPNVMNLNSKNEEIDINEKKSSNENLFEECLKNQELQKISSIICSVESLSNKTNVNKNISRKCSACNRTDVDLCDLLKFKNVEDFIYYFKFLLEKKRNEYQSNPVEYEKNRVILADLLKKSYKVLKKNLSSVKYLCKACVKTFINKENGLMDISTALEVNSIYKDYLNSLKENSADLNVTNSKDLKMQEYIEKEQKTPTNNDAYASILKNLEKNIGPCADPNQQMLHKLMQMQSQQANKQGGEPREPPSTPFNNSNMNNISNNFSNIVDMISSFNNKNQTHNNNMLENVNQLSNIFEKCAENEGRGEQQSVHHLDDTEKKDDNMNVTNIVMNFDHNKNPILKYMTTVLEDLKKQIVTIQNYSMLQKLFISYVFKNLETYMEKVNSNQNVNDFSKLDLSQLLGKIPSSMDDMMKATGMGKESQPGLNLFKKMNSMNMFNNQNEDSNKINQQQNSMDLLKNLSSSVNSEPNQSQNQQNLLYEQLIKQKMGQGGSRMPNFQIGKNQTNQGGFNPQMFGTQNQQQQQQPSLVNLMQMLQGQQNRPEPQNQMNPFMMQQAMQQGGMGQPNLQLANLMNQFQQRSNPNYQSNQQMPNNMMSLFSQLQNQNQNQNEEQRVGNLEKSQHSNNKPKEPEANYGHFNVSNAGNSSQTHNLGFPMTMINNLNQEQLFQLIASNQARQAMFQKGNSENLNDYSKNNDD